MKTSPKFYKSNFISWNRRWVTFRRHIWIILKPTFASILMVLIWKFALVNNGIMFNKSAENPILFMILPLVAFIYVIFASLAVSSVFNEYKTISRSVIKSDLETFLLHRDEQLPIMMHILVGAPSIFLILISMMFNYADFYIGATSVFAVVFVVVITWVISTELDDYRKSIWFKEKIPPHWYEIDIDEHFKKKI